MRNPSSDIVFSSEMREIKGKKSLKVLPLWMLWLNFHFSHEGVKTTTCPWFTLSNTQLKIKDQL